ncbi:hypothetical protein ANCDUO_02096 [Ancylostoma duodenale]|uniref:Uncharacterized protein n=1 Tax=Ancylostoma duodenale TaxID=51022 RepID=A0A0C2HDF3_9BILA|nr:hypothetical protein ANCDUO_02096 [Ancylostoma duodenale]
MRNNLSFLITDILILLLQFTGIVCNGFILFMFFSTPLIIQLKINLTLTIAIALERTLVGALFTPFLYRKLSSALYATMSLLLGMAFACGDLALEFALSPFVEQPNCAAIGCFVSDKFRYYWGTSNMANRTSVGILATSLLFVTLPSVGVGFVEMIGFSIFKTVGPFYIVGLLSAGMYSTHLEYRCVAEICTAHHANSCPIVSSFHA